MNKEENASSKLLAKEVGKSIWSKTAESPKLPTLQEDMTADAVVIGAGLAGVLIAYKLQKSGMDVVVLEMDSVGCGQTKNTTAKITAQHGVIYRDLIKKVGGTKAKQYADANMKAINDYREIIGEKGIECEFEDIPAYLFSMDKKDIRLLKQEAQAASKLGIDAHFTQKTTLPFPICGAVKFENQAQFHPLKFLYGVASALKIFSHTKVTSVKGNIVSTDNGTVQAKHIVFASHYPFMTLPGLIFTKIYQDRSYVIALEDAVKLDGAYLEIGKEGLSLRNSGDLLILGGGDHRTGDNVHGGKYDFLIATAKKLFRGSKEVSRWSAQDCVTVDGLPYIGRYSPSEPSWYVATGFAKWGMTSSMAAADIISDLINKRENPYAEVFSPLRGLPAFSAKRLIGNLAEAVKGLAKCLLHFPLQKAEDLPLGQGGTVRYEGKRVGAYKDEYGKLHIVSLRCPHLGCKLEWNADEKTWDCPCHGSRFSIAGELISNPAQENLESSKHHISPRK